MTSRSGGEAARAVLQGAVLDREAAADLLRAFLDGAIEPEEFGRVLLAWRERPPAAHEVAGFLDVMLAAATPFAAAAPVVLDTCGTGGDHLGTFNISTAAAFTTAACGVAVAKHGGRSVSSPSGSADVLEAAGFPLDCPPQRMERAFAETGFAFLFAPLYHPAMARVAPVRRALGVPTVFNLLGPMANPARPTHQLVGVAGTGVAPLYAEILGQRGTSAWIVQGDGGADEALPGGPFTLHEVGPEAGAARTVSTAALTPGNFTSADFRGGDAKQNASLLMALFDGHGPHALREAVALNAGLALALCKASPSIESGVGRARQVLACGQVRRLWDAFLAQVRP